MNRDDLNFFEPLNWKAESTVSSKFIAIMLMIFILNGSWLFYYLLSERELELQNALDKSKSEIALLKEPAAVVSQKMAYNNFMALNVVNNLRSRVVSKVYFAPVLSRFEQIIPQNMIINSIAVSAIPPASVKPKNAKEASKAKVATKQADNKLNYRMVFSGITTEKQAMSFCDFLVTEQGFGKLIKSAIISDLRTDRSNNENKLNTNFTVECIVVGEEETTK